MNDEEKNDCTLSSSSVTNKHKKRKKHQCPICQRLVYNLKQHHDSCSFVTVEKPHKQTCGDESKGQTRSQHKYVGEFFGTYVVKDSDGSKFFGNDVSLETALRNFLANVNMPVNYKFPIFANTNTDGVIEAYPGCMKNVKEEKCVEEIGQLVKEGKSCYCYEEYVISKKAMNRLIEHYQLPTHASFFNDNSILMTKVAVFFSNGNAVTMCHTDPSSGFLTMICGGVTRVFFPDKLKHATLSAIGDMLFIKHGVKHQVYSKGERMCLTFFSLTEEDYKDSNKREL